MSAEAEAWLAKANPDRATASLNGQDGETSGAIRGGVISRMGPRECGGRVRDFVHAMARISGQGREEVGKTPHFTRSH